MESIRALPVNTPKPLTDASLPADLRAARAALAAENSVNPTGGLSYCTSGIFGASETQLNECADSDNTGYLGYTNTQYNSFSTTFTKYTASTGKKTSPAWSWIPGPNDLKTAYGRCVSFTDCDGVNDVFFKTRSATGQGAATSGGNFQTVYQGQNSVSFWWLYDDYSYPTFLPCDVCDIYPGGEYDPQATNSPQKGIVFYFDYSCTVTP